MIETFMKIQHLIPILFLAAFCTVSAQTNTSNLDIIKQAPAIDSDYHCRDMVRAVNYLRSVGKDKALAMLRDYCKENYGSGKEDAKVNMICKLLFVNPKGWPRSILGMPVPRVTTNGMVQFPIFPLALSDGVPFMLVSGYQGSGQFDSPLMTLKMCDELSVITEDMPQTNYDSAAHSLVNSTNFSQLYVDPRDTVVMTDFIYTQAVK